MSEPLLKIRGLVKHFGAIKATDQLDFNVNTGEFHAVIGPNGAGKTTLISQISGELRPNAGTIHFAGRDITHLPVHKRSQLGLARSYQITSILEGFSVIENVAMAVQAHTCHSFHFWRKACSFQELRRPALEVLDRVGLTERANTPAVNLSHGEQRQLEIAMVLATNPKLLLLDEPTAGMGAEETDQMITLLKGLKGAYTIVLIEHDMDAVFALADQVNVLVYGRLIASGTIDEIRHNPEVRQAYLGEET
jgi:branched-chain amino acid transport system ATP-binding protein